MINTLDPTSSKVSSSAELNEAATIDLQFFIEVASENLLSIPENRD
jgi:hypothetical protein